MSPETSTVPASHQLNLPLNTTVKSSNLLLLFPISPILQILFTRLLEPDPTGGASSDPSKSRHLVASRRLCQTGNPPRPSAGNSPNLITPLTWTLCPAGRFPVGSRFRRSDIQFRRRRRRRSRRTNPRPVRPVIPNGPVLGYFDWGLRDAGPKV